MSASKKRCISSLQVTYHQETHKPTTQLVSRPLQPSTGNLVTETNNYSSCGAADQSLEDAYLQEGEFELNQEDQDFYPPQLPSLPPSSTPPEMLQHVKPSSDSHPALHHPPLPCYPTAAPSSQLFGLEDGLRHRVNVEIENFRASLQEVMREQFASQHHPIQYRVHHCCSGHNFPIKEEERGDSYMHSSATMDGRLHNSSINDNVCSEVSVDSGVCVEAAPTLQEATPTGMEEEMSLALIELQTLAAVISSNLQRTEYTSPS